jgi:hypothetical protein
VAHDELAQDSKALNMGPGHRIKCNSY